MCFCSGLSNYFLKFSEEYKRQHPNEPFTNDWYEFVEYGTTNRLRIILQRSGFKRDSTEYIRRNADKYVRGTPDNPKAAEKGITGVSERTGEKRHRRNPVQRTGAVHR